MNQTLAVTKIEAVEEIGPGIFEVRVSTARGCLNSDPSHEWLHAVQLADMVSQYATP